MESHLDTGISLATQMEIKEEVTEGYRNTLRNKYYGLLCEFEKGREWERFLDSILIELQGIPENERTINFYSIYYKTASLRYIKYEYFRSTIFDIMHLIPSKKEEHDGIL